MIDLYLIFDPKRGTYLLDTRGGIDWVTMKSMATRLKEDVACGLLETPAFNGCLLEYAGTLHPEPKKARKTWA